MGNHPIIFRIKLRIMMYHDTRLPSNFRRSSVDVRLRASNYENRYRCKSLPSAFKATAPPEVHVRYMHQIERMGAAAR